MKKTKNRKKSKNKTRKIFSDKIIPNTIQSSQDFLLSEKDREKRLACYLANNNKIIDFAINIFYFMLSYWKKHYPDNWESIIQDEMLEDKKGNIINKFGFTIEERNKVFELFNVAKKTEFKKYLKDKFFKVTSTLNNLSKPNFIYYHVCNSKKLQAHFIKNLENLFLIKNITWDTINKLYKSLKEKKEKTNFNFFIFDIIIYGDNNKDTLSLYKKNMSYLEFIRKNTSEEDKNKKKNLKHITNCNKSSVSYSDYNKYAIYDSKNVYTIDKRSPYALIMDKYKEPYLSGPSGSTAIMFINLFNFYNFPSTKENKILLLATLIADYIPLWHTIPEILLSFNVEIQNLSIPKYNMNINPDAYVISIIKPYLK
jgi:hypothetical protein